MDLAFYTNEELINELFSRSTFVGVLVVSNDEHTQDDQIHSDYRTHTTISNEQMVVLLDGVVNCLQE